MPVNPKSEPMKQTGIWLDLNGADIIDLIDGVVTTATIAANVEHFHLKGGSRSKTPWGPMEKTSESKLLNRKKQQLNRYYEEICQSLQDSDAVLLFGPAEAKIGLQKHIQSKNNLKDKPLQVQTADSMTLNQKIALVKDFFNT